MEMGQSPMSIASSLAVHLLVLRAASDLQGRRPGVLLVSAAQVKGKRFFTASRRRPARPSSASLGEQVNRSHHHCRPDQSRVNDWGGGAWKLRGLPNGNVTRLLGGPRPRW